MIVSLSTWERFSPKQRWDVLVALRGPDQGLSTIKWFTTAVIRHAMRDVLISIIGKGAGGMINESLGAVILPVSPPRYKEKGTGWQYEEVEENGKTIIKSKVVEAKYPRSAWFDLRHFVEHVDEAAQYLHIPVFTIPFAVWEEAMNADHIGLTIKYLIAYWETEGREEPIVLLREHAAQIGWAL